MTLHIIGCKLVFLYLNWNYTQNFSRNPYKGEIFNRPNGTNVYKNVLKDYTNTVFLFSSLTIP